LNPHVRNLRLLQKIRGLNSVSPFVGYAVPWLRQNQLSLSQITALQAIAGLAAALTLVPTGYFADTFGRQRSIIIGGLSCLMGFVLYAAGGGFAVFVAAQILIAIGAAFISGADDSLANDSLEASGHAAQAEDAYHRYQSTLMGIEGGVEAIGALTAFGLVYFVHADLRTPMVLQVLVYAWLTAEAFRLHEEPPRARRSTAGWSDLRATLAECWNNRALWWQLWFAMAIGSATHTMVWLTQPYFGAAHIGAVWSGLLWAGLLASLEPSRRLAERRRRRDQLTSPAKPGLWRDCRDLVVITTATYALLSVLAPSPLTIALILAFYYVRAAQYPLNADRIRRLVRPDRLATFSSVRTMGENLVYAALVWPLGIIADRSLLGALCVSGVAYLVLAGLGVLMLRRYLLHPAQP